MCIFIVAIIEVQDPIAQNKLYIGQSIMQLWPQSHESSP